MDANKTYFAGLALFVTGCVTCLVLNGSQLQGSDSISYQPTYPIQHSLSYQP